MTKFQNRALVFLVAFLTGAMALAKPNAYLKFGVSASGGLRSPAPSGAFLAEWGEKALVKMIPDGPLRNPAKKVSVLVQKTTSSPQFAAAINSKRLFRSVRILVFQPLSKDKVRIVSELQFSNVQIVSHRPVGKSKGGNEVAMEELVLQFEGMRANRNPGYPVQDADHWMRKG